MNYFIANWKMNMGIKEIISWLEVFSGLEISQSVSPEKTKIIICPSFPHLTLLKETEREMGYETGAQDVSVLEKGAHTGETGTFQIKELCQYSIIGHSEKKEDLETVIKKRDLCIKNKITPIICFIKPEDAVKLFAKEVIMCWEDPNNISSNGKYRDKNPAEIEAGVKTIRAVLPKGTELIYGGSVNRENIKTLSKIEGIDGVLVGNASLDPVHFVDIINSAI